MIDEAALQGRGARIGLTFIGLFLGINSVTLLLLSIPVLAEPIGAVWMMSWSAVMPALGSLFGIEGPISTMPVGSSDMTWNYLQQLCFVVVAAVAAVVWVLREPRRSVHVTADAWLRIVIRYGLAITMLSYGLIKVIPLQFGTPGPVYLARTYGESSPMGLLWSFMGFSQVYAGFAGAAEVLAGLLLLSRRTTTLGALMTFAVMSNVAVMNFCFDVPVKLHSSLLLLMAVYLIGPDLRRFVDVFIHNRRAEPMDLRAPVLGRRLRIARLVAKGGFLLTIVWKAGGLMLSYLGRRSSEPPPLYGAWEVEQFVLGGEVLPPSPGDVLRWRQFTVPRPGIAIVRRAQGEPLVFEMAHDDAAGTVVLTALDATQTRLLLMAARPEPDLLVLTGPIGVDTAEVRLRRIDTEHAPLMTRGFHWITEVPYNH